MSSPSALYSLHNAKIGATSFAATAITAAVGKNPTKLEAGWHVLEPTVDCRVLQCDLVQWTTPPNAATVLAQGRKVLAGQELHFLVDSADAYLLWVRVSADGTMECHRTNAVYVG